MPALFRGHSSGGSQAIGAIKMNSLFSTVLRTRFCGEKPLSPDLKIFAPAPASTPTERQPGNDYQTPSRGRETLHLHHPTRTPGARPAPDTGPRDGTRRRGEHPHRSTGGWRCARRTWAWRVSSVGYCLPQTGQMNSPISTTSGGLLRGGSPVIHPPLSPQASALR